MATLIWTREKDGEKNNGSPAYEYHATGKDGVKYHIVWALDHGGMFGYSAHDPAGMRLSPYFPITWARTLAACKDGCEKIERSRSAPVEFVPDWAGEFTSFDDWVRRASRTIAEDRCPTDTTGGVLRAICIDAAGGRCQIGGDFMRARDEGTFPVRYFWHFKPKAT